MTIQMRNWPYYESECLLNSSDCVCLRFLKPCDMQVYPHSSLICQVIFCAMLCSCSRMIPERIITVEFIGKAPLKSPWQRESGPGLTSMVHVGNGVSRYRFRPSRSDKHSMNASDAIVGTKGDEVNLVCAYMSMGIGHYLGKTRRHDRIEFYNQHEPATNPEAG